jgi:hypothetical protein
MGHAANKSYIKKNTERERERSTSFLFYTYNSQYFEFKIG